MEISTGEGARIYVERKKLGVHYSMPTMQMTKDYYTLGYIISGDFKLLSIFDIIPPEFLILEYHAA